MSEVSWSDLVARARELASGPRRLIGVTGAPGAGKSTVAARLVEELGPDVARLVGMDGFHFASAELSRQHSLERKGAPHTFDVGGYVALLRRLRAADEEIVYVPEFSRVLEEAIGSALAVPKSVPLVVTEGNYLLVQDGLWAGVRPLLDECWYIDPGEDDRLTRLIARHERHGRSPAAARERSTGTDQLNADVVLATRGLADLTYHGAAQTTMRH